MTDDTSTTAPVQALTDAGDGAPVINLSLGLAEARALTRLLPNVEEALITGNSIRKQLAQAVQTIDVAIAKLAGQQAAAQASPQVPTTDTTEVATDITPQP